VSGFGSGGAGSGGTGSGDAVMASRQAVI